MPARFEIFVTSNPGAPVPAVSLATTTAFYGAIYAPQSTVALSAGTAVFGGIVADTLTSSGASVSLHYDQALAKVPAAVGGSAPTYSVIAQWWAAR